MNKKLRSICYFERFILHLWAHAVRPEAAPPPSKTLEIHTSKLLKYTQNVK